MLNACEHDGVVPAARPLARPTAIPVSRRRTNPDCQGSTLPRAGMGSQTGALAIPQLPLVACQPGKMVAVRERLGGIAAVPSGEEQAFLWRRDMPHVNTPVLDSIIALTCDGCAVAEGGGVCLSLWTRVIMRTDKHHTLSAVGLCCGNPAQEGVGDHDA